MLLRSGVHAVPLSVGLAPAARARGAIDGPAGGRPSGRAAPDEMARPLAARGPARLVGAGPIADLFGGGSRIWSSILEWTSTSMKRSAVNPPRARHALLIADPRRCAAPAH